jgi:hypothetical protein
MFPLLEDERGKVMSSPVNKLDENVGDKPTDRFNVWANMPPSAGLGSTRHTRETEPEEVSEEEEEDDDVEEDDDGAETTVTGIPTALQKFSRDTSLSPPPPTPLK